MHLWIKELVGNGFTIKEMLAASNYFVRLWFYAAKVIWSWFPGVVQLTVLLCMSSLKNKKKCELNVIIPPKKEKRFGHCILSMSLTKCTFFLVLIFSSHYYIHCNFSVLSAFSCVHIEKSNKAFKFYKKFLSHFSLSLSILFFFCAFFTVFRILRIY